MSRLKLFFIASSLLVGFSSVFTSNAHGQTTAFTRVNVIPMDSESVISDQTVVVEKGIISAIGPSKQIRIPESADIIDGTGKYLMPGLADLHVHLENDTDLPVYLAHGVTTILDMGAPSILLSWRDQLESKKLIGPHLLVSYFIDGPGGQHNVVATESEARDAIKQASTRGYDYIKVYNSLTTAQFHAIMEEANAAKIAVIGHGVRAPGMREILQSGQVMIAHSEEFIYTFFNNTTNRSRIPSAVELMKNTGAYLLPNLSTFEIISLQWGKPAVVDSLLTLPAARYLHPSLHKSWQSGRYTSRAGSLNNRLIFLRELTKAFADAEIPLLLGTDSPGIPGMFPGASIYNDLRNMVQAGLTPYQALSAGTRIAGQFVKQTKPGSPVFGVIRRGARADLILLNENPLLDVAAVKDLQGVMVSGTWHSSAYLQDLLNSLY